MENLVELKEQPKVDYQQMLLGIIDNLSNYPFKQGGEGFAYFIDDNYVLKQFIIESGDLREFMFENYFNQYCKEIQHFANLGYDIPKIYAWASLPTTNSAINFAYLKKRGWQSADERYPSVSYYILQQRAAGRELFCSDLDSEYTNFGKTLSEDEYGIIINRKHDSKEFKSIFTDYINDFKFMNLVTQSLPQEVIDKIVTDAYNIYLHGQYSTPDIYACNMFINLSKLMLIDQNFKLRTHADFNQRRQLGGNNMLHSFVNLFKDNARPRQHLDYLTQIGKVSPSDACRWDEMIRENERICADTISKFIASVNKNTENPKVVNMSTLNDIDAMLKACVGKANKDEVMQNIELGL